MNKILITGGAGFIGLHLARNLLATHRDLKLDLIDNFARAVEDRELELLKKDSRVRFLTRDVLKPGAYDDLGDDYAHIYHFAAIIGVVHVLNRPYDVLRDNTIMMDNVIALARRQKALKRLTFTSTSEVYAGTLKYFTLPLPTPEATPLAVSDLAHPRTSYMLSKIFGEAMCHHSGVPFTLIRPHNVYGPRMGMAHVVPELLKKMHDAPKGTAIPIASATHSRAFCFVDDAVEIIRRAAESEACRNETLNVGNGDQEITMIDLARTVAASVDRSDLVLEPREAAPGSPERRCPDMSKTIRMTGYRPKFDLKHGVALTRDWYVEHIFKGGEKTAK